MFGQSSNHYNIAESLINPKYVYTTQEDLILEETADQCIWEPSKHIKQLVPNLKDIEIELITDQTDLNVVNAALTKERTIGLVLLGSVIQRSCKPLLIVITTKDKYYAIASSDLERGVKFLKLKLTDEKLKFCLSNGLNESDCLYHNYGINLLDEKNKAEVVCATGLHISMMESMRRRPRSCGLEMYPIKAYLKSRNKNIHIESFDQLVEIWLDINKDDFSFNKNQYAHLLKRPLSVTAVNIIKKRCALVTKLATTLEFYNWLEVKIMSDNTYKLLSSTQREHRETILNVLERNYEKGEVDIRFFLHYY